MSFDRWRSLVDGAEVDVGPAIPDSVDYRLPADEGSGQTVSPSIGDVDLSLEFDRWVSGSQYNGDVAVDPDDGEEGYTEDRVGVNSEQVTVGVWIDGVTVHGTASAFMAANVDEKTLDAPQNGWIYGIEGTDQISLYHCDGGFSQIFSVDLPSGTFDDHLMPVYVGDGDTGEIYLYNADGDLIANESGTESRDIGDAYFNLWFTGGDWSTGPTDDIWAASGTAMSQSEIEDVLTSTGPNA